MTIVLLLLGLTQAARDVPCTPQLAALTTGSSSAVSKLPLWREAEAGAWDGTGWIGWSHGVEALRSVRLNVERLANQRQDDHAEVTVESVPRVEYAVRCMPAVRPGPLQVARRHFDNMPVLNESLGYPHRRLGISLRGRAYEVRLEGNNQSLSDARVVLRDGPTTQVLYSAEGFVDEPHFFIHWAGDLDRDGRLDLIVNLSRKYSMHPYRLLLSSKAARGQLVGDAATFLTGD